MLAEAAIDRTRINVVVARGSAREVGRLHGEQRRNAIAEGLDRWRNRLEETLGVDADAAIARFLAETSFLPAIERHTPDLLEEVRGIAEGANQPFDTILAYNLLDEAWEWVGAQLKPGCTSCGVREGGVPVIAQNMDIPDVHDGAQTVLRAHVDGKPPVIVLTYAGMIGLMGCNADGVAVVVNNLQVLPTADDALPVAFVMRGVLERRTLADAARFVTNVPHAIGQHYAIGSPDGLRAFEGSAAGVVELPADAANYVHANHPLGDTPVRMETEPVYQRSITRERHAKAAASLDTSATIAGIKRALEDTETPVSFAPKKGFMTFGGMVMRLTVPPQVEVTAGPPHLSRWIPVGWS